MLSNWDEETFWQDLPVTDGTPGSIKMKIHGRVGGDER